MNQVSPLLFLGHDPYLAEFEPKQLAALAIVSYLANTFTMLLSKDFTNPLFPYFAFVSFIGEIFLCLWLFVMGVKDSRDKHP